jgi:hypothetical protein
MPPAIEHVAEALLHWPMTLTSTRFGRRPSNTPQKTCCQRPRARRANPSSRLNSLSVSIIIEPESKGLIASQSPMLTKPITQSSWLQRPRQAGSPARHRPIRRPLRFRLLEHARGTRPSQVAPHPSRSFPKLLKAGDVANDHVILEVASHLCKSWTGEQI